LLNTENSPLSSPLLADAMVNSVVFRLEGHMLASGGADGTVRLWDVANPRQPRLLGQPLTDAVGVPIESAAFSGDGHMLAFGDANGTVRLWDVADPAHPRLLGFILTGGAVFNLVALVNSVAFSGDGQMLAFGDADGTVQLWDVADTAHPRLLGLWGSKTGHR
jgi:WD40 repeat protein